MLSGVAFVGHQLGSFVGAFGARLVQGGYAWLQGRAGPPRLKPG
jgi:hypothetical protein